MADGGSNMICSHRIDMQIFAQIRQKDAQIVGEPLETADSYCDDPELSGNEDETIVKKALVTVKDDNCDEYSGMPDSDDNCRTYVLFTL